MGPLTASAARGYGADPPPARGVILGLGRIVAAPEVWLLATGERKEAILRRALGRPNRPGVPGLVPAPPSERLGPRRRRGRSGLIAVCLRGAQSLTTDIRMKQAWPTRIPASARRTDGRSQSFLTERSGVVVDARGGCSAASDLLVCALDGLLALALGGGLALGRAFAALGRGRTVTGTIARAGGGGSRLVGLRRDARQGLGEGR